MKSFALAAARRSGFTHVPRVTFVPREPKVLYRREVHPIGGTLVQGLLPLYGMATRRPALRAVQGPDQARGRQLHREVSAIVQRHLDDACARAWVEVAERYGTHALFTQADPSAASAQEATRTLTTLVTQGVSRLMVAAVVLPPRRRAPRRRRDAACSPRLAAVQGGLSGNGHSSNGHAADGWRSDDPSSR